MGEDQSLVEERRKRCKFHSASLIPPNMEAVNQKQKFIIAFRVQPQKYNRRQPFTCFHDPAVGGVVFVFVVFMPGQTPAPFDSRQIVTRFLPQTVQCNGCNTYRLK